MNLVSRTNKTIFFVAMIFLDAACVARHGTIPVSILTTNQYEIVSKGSNMNEFSQSIAPFSADELWGKLYDLIPKKGGFLNRSVVEKKFGVKLPLIRSDKDATGNDTGTAYEINSTNAWYTSIGYYKFALSTDYVFGLDWNEYSFPEQKCLSRDQAKKMLDKLNWQHTVTFGSPTIDRYIQGKNMVNFITNGTCVRSIVIGHFEFS
jgi:hypothetical protein